MATYEQFNQPVMSENVGAELQIVTLTSQVLDRWNHDSCIAEQDIQAIFHGVIRLSCLFDGIQVG